MAINATVGHKIILLDVDGVLADFVGGTCKLFGWDHAALLASWPIGNAWSYFHRFGMTDADFYGGIARAGALFWGGLDVLPHARELYDHCRALAPTYFCTIPTLDAGSVAGKYVWLEEFTGDRRMKNFVFTHHKQLLARPGILLVDDSDANVRSFREAGGDAVLFPALWNARRSEAGRAVEEVMKEIEAWAIS